MKCNAAKKINLLLLLFSLLGAGVAFVLGELLLDRRPYDLPQMVLVGIYFAIVALCVGIGALVAETISPRLNGQSWKLRYLGTSWKNVPAHGRAAAWRGHADRVRVRAELRRQQAG
ncbi:hypothetical protein ACFSQ7_45050 [Paenibacillus rhizoplanae]